MVSVCLLCIWTVGRVVTWCMIQLVGRVLLVSVSWVVHKTLVLGNPLVLV